MARRAGKRKRQEREEYAFKGQKKVEGGIFDEQTMVYLGKFFNKGIIDKVGFITARGKEADVYLAESGPAKEVAGTRFVVLKFFRIETTSFHNMEDYIQGDPRFKVTDKSKKGIVLVWCRKEYGNLEVARDAGVLAPKPYTSNGSILAMEFIGSDEGVPAKQLKDVKLENPLVMEQRIMEQLRRLYGKELVHADMSEYNVLVKDNEPYLIDFGQAVTLRHPKAVEFLHRDVSNILHHFSRKYGIDMDFGEALKYVTGEGKGN